MSSINIYQAGVKKWMDECFTPETVTNKRERAFRLLEEALELFQSMDCTSDEAQGLVYYVFNRPVGQPEQEVGGVALTLAALCSAAGIDLNHASVSELARVQSPEVMAKIKAKRATRAVPGDYVGETNKNNHKDFSMYPRDSFE
jgi:hypothetical protein